MRIAVNIMLMADKFQRGCRYANYKVTDVGNICQRNQIQGFYFIIKFRIMV